MKLLIENAAARRAALQALCRLPEDVRRFAMESVVFASVGRVRVGLAITPELLKGAEWVVLLAERDGIADTLAHEVGHAVSAHDRPSEQAEREAAGLARAWGFAADPDGCAATFAESRQPVTLSVVVAGAGLTVKCGECGAACRLLAPAVPGIHAEAGVQCETCDWLKIFALDDLLGCPKCEGRVVALWTQDATPAEARATWTCACGESLTLRLQCEPVAPAPSPRQDVAPEAWAMATAANMLMSLEEALRRLPPDADAMAREVIRVRILYARQRVLCAARLLTADTGAAMLVSVADEIAAATPPFLAGDFAGAADRVAGAARDLNALLAAKECRA
jgi:hypothetical protein